MQAQTKPGLITLRRITIALLAGGVLGAGATFALQQRSAPAAGNVAAAVAPAAAPPAAGAAIALPDFSDIAARNGPAVVNISVTGTTKVGYDRSSQGQGAGDAASADDPFFEFFRRFQNPQGRSSARDVPVRGHGSGFIVSADGIIMTNAHVVQGASEVTVKLTDRREFRAKVLGADPKTDIAILKIDAQNLPQVALAAKDDLRVGEWVLAIGSPFGFDSTVTAGVVSAKGRSLPDDSNVPFIQTDVAINPGNSGGPLFNARGEVIGVNSQIFSQTGGYQGLSFAIPIDVANHVRRQIVATGKVAHAKLGVTVQEVNQGFADSFKLASPEGALVANVEPGGPADKAGLQAGDVVRKMDGKAIIGSVDLPAQVAGKLPGDKITLDLWRDGKMIALAATLGNAADPVQGAGRADAPAGKLRLGLALRPLQVDEQRAAGLRSGLLVEDADGASANAGVQRGDVLLSINGKAVGSLAEVRDLLSKSAKSVALLVLRGNDRIFIPVRLG
jgi:serine protease Do